MAVQNVHEIQHFAYCHQVGYCTIRPFHCAAQLLKRNPKKKSPSQQQLLQDAKLRVQRAEGQVPFQEFSEQELNNIFGCEVSKEEGNHVLRVLHRRRVIGSLVEKGIKQEGSISIPSSSLKKALEWLRESFPIDEEAAASVWAEKALVRETQRMEEDYFARGQKLKIFKQTSMPHVETSRTAQTGTSALDELRKENIRKREEEEKRKIASGEAQMQQELALAKNEEREKQTALRTEQREKRRTQRQKKGMVSEGTEVPNMTNSQRLGRCTLFAVVTLLISLYYANNYEPPAQSNRWFPMYPVAVCSIAGIVGVNTFIWMCWRLPPMWRLLNAYFTMVPALPYTFSTFGNIISHRSFIHLAQNMVALIAYGVYLHEDIGRANLNALYITGGVFGTIVSLYYHVLTRQLTFYSQGASGAVWAIMAAWGYCNLQQPKKEAGSRGFMLDTTLWSILSFQLLVHLHPSVYKNADMMAHVGGAITGLVYARFLHARTAKRQKIEAETQTTLSNGIHP